MAQSVVSVRMDETLKRDFDAVCNELGMSMSTVVNVLAKKMTREKRVPFEVSIDPFFSDLNMQALNESIREKDQGKVVVKTMSELDEMANG